MTVNEDYSKIADHVVEKVIELNGFELNEAQMKRLLQGKTDRARAMIEARKNLPEFHSDY